MTSRRALVTSLILFAAAALVALAAPVQAASAPGCIRNGACVPVAPGFSCASAGLRSCTIPGPTPPPVVIPTPVPVVTPAPVVTPIPTPGPTPPPAVTPTPLPDETELTVTPMLRLDPAKVAWTATGNVLVYDGRLRYILICPPAAQPQNCWKAYYTARRP